MAAVRMSGEELDRYELEGVFRYLSQRQFAELFGVKSNDLQRLLTENYGLLVLDPDVVGEPIYARDLPDFDAEHAARLGVGPDRVVAGQRGWLRERAVAWGMEIGKLAPDGTPTGQRSWRLKGDPPAHWRKKPVALLTQVECARLLGYSAGVGVYQLRQRGTFTKPAAVVGDIRLWDIKDVVRWARQTGRAVNEDVLQSLTAEQQTRPDRA